MQQRSDYLLLLFIFNRKREREKKNLKSTQTDDIYFTTCELQVCACVWYEAHKRREKKGTYRYWLNTYGNEHNNRKPMSKLSSWKDFWFFFFFWITLFTFWPSQTMFKNWIPIHCYCHVYWPCQWFLFLLFLFVKPKSLRIRLNGLKKKLCEQTIWQMSSVAKQFATR